MFFPRSQEAVDPGFFLVRLHRFHQTSGNCVRKGLVKRSSQYKRPMNIWEKPLYFTPTFALYDFF
jgi:hypothetical protein